MADQVIDVVTKLSYESDNSDLVQASNLVKANINNINTLTAALQKQQATLAATSRTDRQSRQAQQAAINATKAAIDKETKSLETNILANKELQQTIAKEVGLLGKLGTEMDRLRAKRDLATDPKKVKEFTKDIAAMQAQVNSLTSGRSGTGIGGAVLQGLGLAGGFGIAGLVSSGVGVISDFVRESSRLASETEGVKKAFDRLDSPDLLDNLRAATKGTVSDLELMKQAVQFKNFGLPVAQLASGLEFARIRAKETGQSVDFLVQSITTGIGRQSPLILDNLGINARRVREEFQKTGDFAQAAFKIIQEETQKAGVDVESFSEKQARLNAILENQQAIFGKGVNNVTSYLQAIATDIFDSGDNAGLNAFFGAGANAQKFLDIKAQQEQANEELRRAQANADALFLQDFQGFANRYKASNVGVREDIKNDAKATYDFLLQQAQVYYASDKNQLDFYINSLRIAYQRLQDGFKNARLNLQTLSPSDIIGFSRDKLMQVQDEIDLARNSLTSSDTKQINQLNRLTDAVKKQLDIINGVKKATTTVTKPKQNFVLKSLGFESESFSEAERELNRFLEILNKIYKTDDNANFGVVEPFQRAGIPNAQDDAAQTAIRDGIRLAEIEKENADKEQAIADKRRERIIQSISDYQMLAGAVVDAFNVIYDAQQRQLDAEISIRERRVESARLLAERGSVEALKIEEERLNESLRQQQDFARQQAAINSALQLSYSLLAVAGVIASPPSVATGGLAAAPLIAALLGVLANGYALATSLTQDTGFAEGGYTGDGGKYEKAGTVHKGEFVMPKSITSENRGLLEAIYTGKVNEKSLQGVTGTGKVDFRSLEDKMDTLIDVTEGTETKVYNNITSDKFTSMVQRQRRINKRKFH